MNEDMLIDYDAGKGGRKEQRENNEHRLKA